MDLCLSHDFFMFMYNSTNGIQLSSRKLKLICVFSFRMSLEKDVADITFSSFETLEMKGQVECLHCRKQIFHAVCFAVHRTLWQI